MNTVGAGQAVKGCQAACAGSQCPALHVYDLNPDLLGQRDPDDAITVDPSSLPDDLEAVCERRLRDM